MSKILTAHLGEHVLASRGISLPFSLSLLSSPPLLHVYATGVRDKVKGVSVWRGRGREEGVWTGKKKFSSYPLDENAVPKLVARFVTESSRETRSSPGNCRPGTGLSQLLAFDQLSPSLVLHHLSNLWFWIDFFDFFFRPFFFLSLRREIGRIRDWTQTFRKFFPRLWILEILKNCCKIIISYPNLGRRQFWQVEWITSVLKIFAQLSLRIFLKI